jgi:hypothetical protein
MIIWRLAARAISSPALLALLLGFSSSTQAQDSSRANSPTLSVITGKVVIRDGESVTNARVSIGRVNSVLNLSTPSKTVRVESGGTFITEPLDPGLYWLGAYLPGYVTDTSQGPTPVGFYRPGDNVTLALIKGAVITGTVKDSNGEPVIALPVRAVRVRDAEGKPLQFAMASRERLTDDRGIYRLYGLSPGTYIIASGGSSRAGGPMQPGPYDFLTPTYAPSSTRDTAVEVAANGGDEIRMDIQFRGEPGHAISGSIAGTPVTDTGWGVGITLFDLRNHSEVANSTASQMGKFAFSLYGIPDGEYELFASLGSPSGESLASSAKRIEVKGSDVTGISLTVAPLASISGRVIFEPDAKAACGKRRDFVTSETSVYARRYQTEGAAPAKDSVTTDVPFVVRNSARQATLDAKGLFTLGNVYPGNYRIDPREPAPGWYVRSITLETAKTANVVRDGMIVKSGERVSGLAVTMTEGAAKLSGRIVLDEAQSVGRGLRVYLVPTERNSADNFLRFYEARPDGDRNFTIDNLAPGSYWIITRPVEENDFGIAKGIRQDAGFRAKVLHDAEAIKKEIVFKPCERVTEYDVAYTVPTTPQ